MKSTVRSPLAVCRFATGLTQAQLADRAGISRLAVINLENGKHRPHPLTARALAEALCVEVTTIFPSERRDGDALRGA
jgi:DNA-binding XRE family transcriptional regulator